MTWIELSGQLKVPVFHCADEPHELGYSLIARGEWALRSADGTFMTNGWFESADTVAPLAL